MQYYRCKCGSCEAWGSDGPRPCSGCLKCGSNLASHPDFHAEPLPHDFSSVETVRVDQGEATITRCNYCHRTKEQIEKRDGREKFAIEARIA